MKNLIIIFGASSGGLKVLKCLEDLGIGVSAFSDNDSAKWNKKFAEIPVVSPEQLISYKYPIIIASIYRTEIMKQLLGMGIHSNRIFYSKEIFIYQKEVFADIVRLDESSVKEPLQKKMSQKRQLIFECEAGWGLGGIQKLSQTIIGQWLRVNRDFILLCRDNYLDGSNVPEQYKKYTKYYTYSEEYYKSTLKQLVKLLFDLGPINLILNVGIASPVALACFAIKTILPEYINVVYYIHDGTVENYLNCKTLEVHVNQVACVSRDIRNIMIDEYNFPKEKIHYKESPIQFDEEFQKTYSDKSGPIKIGFAARIEKQQKRAELLPVVAKMLENKGIPFELEIAGDGSYFSLLQDKIKEQGLEKKVHLWGKVSFDYMNQFFSKCDLFLSLSDHEGVGLSMLEAMSVGVVPIVTDVCGATEFVEDGVNGFIFSNQKLERLIDIIGKFEENRSELPYYGKLNRDKIRQACNLLEYIKYLEHLLLP